MNPAFRYEFFLTLPEATMDAVSRKIPDLNRRLSPLICKIDWREENETSSIGATIHIVGDTDSVMVVNHAQASLQNVLSGICGDISIDGAKVVLMVPMIQEFKWDLHGPSPYENSTEKKDGWWIGSERWFHRVGKE